MHIVSSYYVMINLVVVSLSFLFLAMLRRKLQLSWTSLIFICVSALGIGMMFPYIYDKFSLKETILFVATLILLCSLYVSRVDDHPAVEEEKSALPEFLAEKPVEEETTVHTPSASEKDEQMPEPDHEPGLTSNSSQPETEDPLFDVKTETEPEPDLKTKEQENEPVEEDQVESSLQSAPETPLLLTSGTSDSLLFLPAPLTYPQLQEAEEMAAATELRQEERMEEEEFDSETFLALLDRVYMERSSGNMEEALALLQEMIAMNPPHDMLTMLAIEAHRLYQRKGQYLKARYILQLVLYNEKNTLPSYLVDEIHNKIIRQEVIEEVLYKRNMSDVPVHLIPRYVKKEIDELYRNKLKEIKDRGVR